MRRGRLGLVPVLALAACSPPKPTHDLAYYRTHPDERARVLAACRSDLSTVGTSQDCPAALAADRATGPKAFWTVAPLPSRVRNPGRL